MREVYRRASCVFGIVFACLRSVDPRCVERCGLDFRLLLRRELLKDSYLAEHNVNHIQVRFEDEKLEC